MEAVGEQGGFEEKRRDRFILCVQIAMTYLWEIFSRSRPRRSDAELFSGKKTCINSSHRFRCLQVRALVLLAQFSCKYLSSPLAASLTITPTDSQPPSWDRRNTRVGRREGRVTVFSPDRAEGLTRFGLELFFRQRNFWIFFVYSEVYSTTAVASGLVDLVNQSLQVEQCRSHRYISKFARPRSARVLSHQAGDGAAWPGEVCRA